MSLFYLNTQCFKVLKDNVPVINKEGVCNIKNLTLINFDELEQIEIIEIRMNNMAINIHI